MLKELMTAGIGRLMHVWFVLVFTGCTFMWKSEEPLSAKGTQYKISFDSPDWTSKPGEGRSDYVWENKKDGRILLSNSFCQEFQDRPLEELALKTFRAVGKHKIEKKDYTTFQKREAYKIEGKGNVDGVPVGLILLNTRRNNCYFDFLSITPLNSAREVHRDFEKFLNAVEFK